MLVANPSRLWYSTKNMNHHSSKPTVHIPVKHVYTIQQKTKPPKKTTTTKKTNNNNKIRKWRSVQQRHPVVHSLKSHSILTLWWGHILFGSLVRSCFISVCFFMTTEQTVNKSSYEVTINDCFLTRSHFDFMSSSLVSHTLYLIPWWGHTLTMSGS